MNILFTLLGIAVLVFFWIQYFKTRKKRRNTGKSYKKQLQKKISVDKNLKNLKKR